MPDALPHLHVVLLADDFGPGLWPLARAASPACLAPPPAGGGAAPDAAAPEGTVASDAAGAVVAGGSGDAVASAPTPSTADAPVPPRTLLAAAVCRMRDLTEWPLHVVCDPQTAGPLTDELASIGGLGPTRKPRRRRASVAGGAPDGGGPSATGDASAGGADIICVPHSRGSALAIALACACARRADPDAVVFVAAASQYVDADERWESLVYRAYQVALRDRIALIAESSAGPSGARGWLRAGRPFANIDGAFEVTAIRANAAPSAADRAVAEGGARLTGMYVARATTMLGAFGTAEDSPEPPAKLTGTGSLRAVSPSKERKPKPPQASRIAETASFFAMLDRDAWSRDEAADLVDALPEVGIEEAVFAVPERLVAVPTSIAVTSTTTLADLDATLEADDRGNRISGDAVVVDADGATAISRADGRLVCAFGVTDIMVVDTDDAVLVADKRRLRDASPLTDALAAAGAPQLARSARRSFSWGSALLVVRDSGAARTTASASAGPQSGDAAYGRHAGGEGAASADGGVWATWRVSLAAGASLGALELCDAFDLPGACAGAEAGSTPAVRVQCVVLSGTVAAERTPHAADPVAAVAGCTLELPASRRARLMCDNSAPAELLVTVIAVR